MSGLRTLSLFSNVAGLELGLHAAGVETVGFCEIDPQARMVLAYHWPDVPCATDVTTLDGSEFHGRVDLVAGGSPCTDLSMAGRRQGLGGVESRLFWDQCRIATESAARWVLWENVDGALTSNAGADFAAVLWGFTGVRPAVPENGWGTIGVCIGDERAVVWRVFQCRWFGVAQRRRRVFAIGCSRADIGRAIEVLVEPDSVPRGAVPGGETGAGAAVGTLGSTSPGGGWRFGADEAAAGQLIPTITTRGGYENRNAGESLIVADLVQITSATNRSNPQPGDPSPTLAATSRPIAFGWSNAASQGAAVSIDEVQTLRSTMQPAVLTSNVGVRRLMPVECERLMGWPDDHTRWGRKPDGTVVEMSDSARYRFCGLGVIAPVAEWIGRRLGAVSVTEDTPRP